MSGIEVAGLVLGAVPILITAVQIWRDGSEKTLLPFRKRRIVDKLTNALLLQKQTVAETVHLLTVHSGCTSHDEASLSHLNDDPVAYLQNEDVQDLILDFLGEKNNAALTGALREIEDILKRVAGQLAGIVLTNEDRSDDLLGIIKANQALPPQQLDFIRRVRLMFSNSDMSKSIEALDSATNSLHRFSQLILMNRLPSLATDSSRAAVRIAKGLCAIRTFATDLCAALCRSCWDGICHSKHEANIFLEDRVDAASEILRRRRKPERGDDSVLVFKLIFRPTSLAPAQGYCCELPVRVMKRDENAAIAEVTVATARVKLAVPQITQTRAILTPVHDFCATVSAARCEVQPVNLVLSDRSQLATMAADEKSIVHYEDDGRITLKEVLSGDSLAARNLRFPLRLRMLLALQIASSLLQLSHTWWSSQAWTKETIHFLLRPAGPGGETMVDFGRCFVSAAIEDNTTDPLARRKPQIEPRLVLLELGILLLEVWHQKTMEARFGLDQMPTAFFMRCGLAMEWLNDDDDPPLHLYRSAVSYCINGTHGGGARLSSWDEQEFCNRVCKDVVEPLLKNCKQWR